MINYQEKNKTSVKCFQHYTYKLMIL
ncbi:uncharacterized protein METZ01_LOCUS157007 [marine metagenome]|uniref:Uncharacterized protein n=1 Tax=marine metagenome TaxID=408172 RepID=A0A382AT12_9ZZZZ